MKKGIFSIKLINFVLHSKRRQLNAKKLIFIVILGILLLGVTSCKNENIDWDNATGVMDVIKLEHRDQILNNIDKAFNNFEYLKVYALGKLNVGVDGLNLLFILDKTDDNKRKEFINTLEDDYRVSSVKTQEYVSFNTIDTRRIEAEKTIIQVGERLDLIRVVYSSFLLIEYY